MRSVQYKVSAPGHENHLTVTYQDGTLSAIEGIHLMAKLWEDVAINAPIPIQESEIPARMIQFAGLVEMEEIALSATGKKIALFCAIYQEETHAKYQVQPGDDRKISALTLSESLLRLYFRNGEWWGKQPKGIANLATNWNALLQLQENGKRPKKKNEFPDEYSKTYEDSLAPTSLPRYWAHLRGLGYKVKKDSAGRVVAWEKALVVIILLITIFASGCMTPQRAARYTARYPEFFPTRIDTFYKPVLFNFRDTLLLPGDAGAWDWFIPLGDSSTVQGDTFPSTWFDFDTTLTGTKNRITTKVKIKTHTESNSLQVSAETETTPDTIYLDKLIEVPCPQVEKTTTIVVKQHWWMRWAIGLLLLLLIWTLWQRKR